MPSRCDHDRTRLDRVRRAIVLRALELAAAPTRRHDRYRSCGTRAWLQYHPTTQQARISRNHCWDSLCPRCSRIRAARLADRLQPVLQNGATVPRLRHITLTLRSSDAPIRDQVTRLRASFRRLRQQRLWKDLVAGGFAAVEVTYQTATEQWHPHLHIIAESKYIPHSRLRDAWLRASGDSYIVHLSRVPARGDRVARYVAKYAGKGLDPLKIPSAQLAEWIIAGAHGRLWTTFGSWHGAVPPRSNDPDYWDGWVRIDDVSVLLAAARDGDPDAAWLLELAGLDPAEIDAPPPPPDWRPWPPNVVLGPSEWSLTLPEQNTPTSHTYRRFPPRERHNAITAPSVP